LQAGDSDTQRRCERCEPDFAARQRANRRARRSTSKGRAGGQRLRSVAAMRCGERFSTSASKGVVAKRLREPYRPGGRGWVKKKNPDGPRFPRGAGGGDTACAEGVCLVGGRFRSLTLTTARLLLLDPQILPALSLCLLPIGREHIHSRPPGLVDSFFERDPFFVSHAETPVLPRPTPRRRRVDYRRT
jgi:hypothetical protein